MNISIKPLCILVLALVFIGVIVFAAYEKNRADENEQSLNAKKTLVSLQAKIIDKKTDSAGITHSQIDAKQNQVAAGALNDTGNWRKTALDTIRKAVNLPSAAPIQEVTRIDATFKVENLKLKDSLDKLNQEISFYHDKWIDLVYHHAGNTVDLEHNINLTDVRYQPAQWWPFGKKDPVMDFYFDDPRMSFNHIDHLDIVPPEKKVGFSSDVRAAYLFSTGRMVPSAGAQLSVGKWYLEGREYYNTDRQRFSPLLAFGYRYLNF